MYLPLPVLLGLGLAFLLLLVLAFRRRGDRSDLMAPPRAGPPAVPASSWPVSAAPIGELPEELVEQVRALRAADRKIEAIKLLRAATGLGLAEAKDMMERI